MTKKYENLCNETFKEYWQKIEDIANLAFEEKIKPYLQKYALEFYSGNGTYLICPTENTPKWFIEKYRSYGGYDLSIDQDKIDKRISEILEFCVEGYNNNLGGIMPNYKP